MPVASSGAIDLDEFHQEAGGSANSNCSINDADIRGLIDKSDGATMAFNEWYGAESSLPGDLMLIGLTSASGSVSGEKIHYITITSTGNGTDFGTLIGGRRTHCGTGSSSTRGLVAGGTSDTGASGGFVADSNVVQYLTINTLGDGTDFGDLQGGRQGVRGQSNATRAVFSEGADGDIISYFTIANTGNATDFGNMTGPANLHGGNITSTTRGVWHGGRRNYAGSKTNIMDYVTIASTGNATDFGDVNEAIVSNCGYSSSVRGVICHGTTTATATNTMSYITIASTGNSQDFGDLTNACLEAQASGNATRGVRAGGNELQGGSEDSMDYITFASTGNSTDFGDIGQTYVVNTYALSNSHGGL